MVVINVVAERERVKKLVDLVPAKDLDTVARMLRGLAEDPVLWAFAHAPNESTPAPTLNATAPPRQGGGSRIAFSSGRDGDYEIYVINADGSRQTNLTNNPRNDGDPAWSPK